MKNVIFKSFTAHLSEDGNYVEGYASTYGNIDRVGDIVEKGAFSKTLDTKNRAAPVRFLWQHDPNRPIGFIEKLEDRPEGLWFKARFANTTDGRDARENFLSGTVDRFSIGYQVVQRKADRVNGRPVNRLTELKLFEISAVTFPANEEAMMTAVKNADPQGELSEENRALLVQMANLMLAAQGSSAAPAEDVAAEAPAVPVEGEQAPEGAETAADEEAPANEGAEAQVEDEALAPGEEAEAEKPEEGEEEDEKAKKKALDTLQNYLAERKLRELLAARRA